MLTFRQYLDEVARSPERAAKLVDNLHKRQNRDNTYMARGVSIIKKSTYGGKRNEAWKRAVWNRAANISTNKFKENPDAKYSKAPEIKQVPLHKVRDIQGAVGAKGVKREIAKQSGGADPKHSNSSKRPIFMYHAKTDTYHPVDGNHRLAARRAREGGDSHVEGEVHTI